MWVQDTSLIMPHTTRHAEFSSASHCEPCLVLVLGEILKQVQDDQGFRISLRAFTNPSPRTDAETSSA